MTKLLTAILLIMLMSAGCQRMSQTRYPVDWPEKMVSTSQCPDLSGIYYDRVSDAYSDDPAEGANPRTSGIQHYTESKFESDRDAICAIRTNSPDYYIDAECSLATYFGTYFSPIDYPSIYWTEKCPERKIEFSKTENLNIDAIFYKGNEVVKKISINLDGTKYRCEDGSIVLKEKGSPEEFFYHRTEIFPTTGGSLIVKDYDKIITIMPPLPPVPVTSLRLYQWDRVDSGVNPYKDCH